MNDFFNAALPPEKTGEVYVGGTIVKVQGKDGKAMLHKHATTHAELAKLVADFDTQGQESYFALSRFTPHKSTSGKSPGRQGKYAIAVKSFWLDLDCGEDKAKDGDGYESKKLAVDALYNFLTSNELPMPSYMVDSGGGIHVYFALTEEIGAEVWQPVATKLKELCIVSKFLADKSRTDDIASVLRPPGTHNHKSKYGTPRPVVIKHSGPLISFGEFAAAIDNALQKHGVNYKPKNPKLSDVNATTTRLQGSVVNVDALLAERTTKSAPLTVPTAFNLQHSSYPETADHVEQLKEALATIPAARDEGCDYECWRNMLWALASTDWSCAKEIAKVWSQQSPADYNEADFERTWGSYNPAKDRSITVGTLFYIAKQYGYLAPSSLDFGKHALTDTGNARRFAKAFSGCLRFVHGVEQWMYWSPSESRWVFCFKEEQIELAKKFAEEMLKEVY